MGVKVSVEKLLEVIESIKDDLSDVDAVKQSLPEVLVVVEDVKELFADGFQWSDVGGFLGKVVPGLMDISKSLKGKTGDEKREYVVDACWTIYKVFDPNIPWLPEPFETKLERVVVRRVAEAAVEAVYEFGKKKGYWDEDGEEEEENPIGQDA